MEEIELRNNFKDFYASISNTRNDSKDNDEQDPNPLQTPKLDKWETMDVFGQQAEPICTYYRCNHTFSAHGLGTRGCKCKHPTNETLGISLRVL